MKTLQQYLGGGARPPEDTVLVLAPSGEVPDALVDALGGGGVRVSTVVAAAGPVEAAGLAARFPGALVRVLPGMAPVQAVLAALRVRAVLAVAPDRLEGGAARLFKGAKGRGVPVYALRAAGENVLEDFREIGASGDLGGGDRHGDEGPPANHATGNSPGRGESCKRTVPPGRGSFTGIGGVVPRGEESRVRAGHGAAGGRVVLERLSGGAPAPDGPLTAAEAAALLARATGAGRAPALSLDRLAARVARAGPGRVSGGFVRRIETIEALRARLGTPGCVLCLGNGPTSADPAVLGFAHDALFRVNVDWRGAGVLAEPDMVFAGVKRAMRRLGRGPLGVATGRKEAALLACRLFEPWHGPVSYAVAERLAAGVAPPIVSSAGAAQPTTGAWMLAVAVALAPARLAVAGMDMFSHPAGAYPPGTDPTAGGSVNAFAAAHDFETDAAFVAACLSHHAGELVVFSPALATLLRARCPDAPFTMVDRSGGAAG